MSNKKKSKENILVERYATHPPQLENKVLSFLSGAFYCSYNFELFLHNFFFAFLKRAFFAYVNCEVGFLSKESAKYLVSVSVPSEFSSTSDRYGERFHGVEP